MNKGLLIVTVTLIGTLLLLTSIFITGCNRQVDLGTKDIVTATTVEPVPDIKETTTSIAKECPDKFMRTKDGVKYCPQPSAFGCKTWEQCPVEVEDDVWTTTTSSTSSSVVASTTTSTIETTTSTTSSTTTSEVITTLSGDYSSDGISVKRTYKI